MPIQITNIEFFNELHSESTDWLLANVGDQIRAEITFEASTYAQSSAKSPFTLNAADGYIGAGWVTSRLPAFKDFNVGDTLLYYYYPTAVAQTYSIIAKKSDREIQLNIAIPSVADDTLMSAKATFCVTTPILGIKYNYNLIENDEQVSYLSKVDGSLQQYIHKSVNAASTTPLAMLPQGAESWQIGGASAGNATVEGVSITASPIYTSRFKIKHTFIVTPFMLSEIYADLIAGIPPVWLKDGASLKFINRIEALYDFNNPNEFQFIEQTNIKGNVGSYDENFNGNPSKYRVDSITFHNELGQSLTALELTGKETTVEAIISNVTGPFSNNNTKFVLGICKAPANQSEYQLNGKTITENFIFDKATQTVGAAVVNGVQYGTDQSCLTAVAGVYTSATSIKIQFKVKLTAASVLALAGLETKRYALFLSIQNHTLNTKIADKVTLMLSTGDYIYNTVDDGLVQQYTVFLRHHESDADTEGIVNLDVFPEDEIVAETQFYIDKTNCEPTDMVSIRMLEMAVKAKNTVTGQEFTLQRTKYDMSNAVIVNDNQFVDATVDRNFHIPATEPRRNLRVQRMTSIDTASRHYYNISYPFLFRWEYWEALVGVNSAFFDTSEPKNGYNNSWFPYTNKANWNIYYETAITVSKNGNIHRYTSEAEITANDYESNPAYTATLIETYDSAENLLYNSASGKKYIQGYEDTKVVASFTKSSSISLSACAVVFGIEAYEKGGQYGRRRYSSAWASDGDTWFKELVPGAKAGLISTGPNSILAVCLIDHTKLPINAAYKITARLYDNIPGDDTSKLTEDGVRKLTEISEFKLLE